MSESAASPTIVIALDGPYIVAGNVPVAVETIVPNADGDSWEWKTGTRIAVSERYALCRCGASEKKPLCDGAHAHNGFDGTECAARTPFDGAKTFGGPGLVLEDRPELCAFARFCDAGDTIWQSIGRVDEPGQRDLVLHAAARCPSGRLVVRDAESGEAREPAYPPAIGVVEDPGKAASGPLYVRGGISLFSADGTPYPVRNRMALCRCGGSNNKPFCDGTHADVAFVDDIAAVG